MNIYNNSRIARLTSLFLLCISVTVYNPVRAEGVPPLNISKLPLNATLTTPPNVLYILDDSGSMDYDFLPLWVADPTLGAAQYCRTANGTNFNVSCNASTTFNSMPPFRSSDFNSLYYNPSIRYTPAKNADGTSKPEQTSWTSVQNDAYGIQSTASTNLVTGYTDTEWCTSTAYNDCLRSDNYILPATGILNPTAKSYTIAHKVPAYISVAGEPVVGKVATGSRVSPTIETRFFGPHYYVINAGEFCDSAALTNCQETQTATFSFPAKVRWCDSEANSIKPPNTVGSTSCQGTRTNTRKIARYPTKYLKTTGGVTTTTVTGEVLYVQPVAQIGTAPVAAIPAKAEVLASVTITFTLGSNCEGSSKAKVSEVNVNSVNILPTPTGSVSTAAELVTALKSGIDSAPAPRPYTTTVSGTSLKLTAVAPVKNIVYPVAIVLGSGSCSVAISPTSPKFSGYTAATPLIAAVPASSNYVAGVAGYCPAGYPNGPTTISGLATSTTLNSYGHKNGQQVCRSSTSSTTPTVTQYYGSFSRVDIVPNGTYPPTSISPSGKAAARTDCAGTTCTYTEEMTNFANWWTYYHTRMQAMKTATSLAFDSVGSGTRVGFSTISDTAAANGPLFLNIGDFGPSQKSSWYTTLFNSKPEGATPLREALSQAGRLYANQLNASDPVQYSCQKNYALLTTDGYWNGDNPTGPGGKLLNGEPMTNQDNNAPPGKLVARPKREGTAAIGTLADVAKYYYDNDLRTPALENCVGVFGADVNVCQDGTSSIVQNMSTFTLGLGVDGTLRYTKDYKAGSGDYANILAGTKDWPSPFIGDDEKIDDLWHAAVNGEGTYFSAKNPNDVIEGLTIALASIGSTTQAGAATAFSNEEPVAGDNFTYRPTFTTDQWTGNLEKRTVDPTTGDASNLILKCVENVIAEAPNTGCTATAKVSPRNVYINSGGVLADFTYDNIPDELKSYFGSGWLSMNLSQWSQLSDDQKVAIVGTITTANQNGLVKYLKGETNLEDRTNNLVGSVDNRIFRYRSAQLGDIIGSAPIYTAFPDQKYGDPGYSSYKSDNGDRAPTVYVGANDGMLHAFNAETLEERWAFIPTAVIPKLWYLADKNYLHENYVNSTVVVSDAYVNGSWKTILVGGLDGGGRGYYALDISNPAIPVLLWEFTHENMGYTFGQPVITKNLEGRWVVLLTSGYNNWPDSLKNSGNGGGYMYVVDAGDGELLQTYTTGEGSEELPSGLAKISAYVNDPDINNTVIAVYGGDLAGNVWRFNINEPAAAGTNPLLFAKLKDSEGLVQAITAKPVLGEIDGKRIVFVGTGKYIEVDDRTTTQPQTLYAIQDNDVTTTLTDPRSVLIRQRYTSNGDTRSSTNNAVNFDVNRGWFVDLPDPGERQYIDGALLSGDLTIITNVPTGTGCNPSGYSWINYINYRTGGGANTITNNVSARVNSAVLGGRTIMTRNGLKYTLSTTKGFIPIDAPPPVGGTEFKGNRSIWRELNQ